MTPQPNQKPFSVWDYKPWWCQPWSIVLTTITLISGSWIMFKTVWITVLVAVPVLTWMVFFVGIYPQLAAQIKNETTPE